MKTSASLLLTTTFAAASAFAEWHPMPAGGSGRAPMMTEWGERVTPENAWRGYPRPQMVRVEWTNLNGLWDYAITTNGVKVRTSPFDASDPAPTVARGKILVPFAIESPLSGVGRLLDAKELLWYRRTIDIKPENGKRVILHFGAVDFRASVFIGHDCVMDAPHEGGWTPFSCDITDFVKPGENELVVCVWDPTQGYVGSTGKQTPHASGPWYTRSSGIWQTVWMESVPEKHISGYDVKTDIDKGEVTLAFHGTGNGEWGTVEIQSGRTQFRLGEPVTIKLPEPVRLWSPDSPALYDFTAKFGDDEIKGYFAMRRFSVDKDGNGVLRFHLNNKPIFIYGPLDQGYWPDGILTPPSEEAMAFDIKAMKGIGCNVMRKHMKTEPAQWYRLCDEIGMIVLQDMPAGFGRETERYGFFRREAKDILDSLRVFQCIVMWCPYNEYWGQPGAFFTHETLDWVRRYDRTRLVDAASGGGDWEGGSGSTFKDHRPAGVCEAGDVVDMHTYPGPGMFPVNPRRVSFLGEFGGAGQLVDGHVWNPGAKCHWHGKKEDSDTPEKLEKKYISLLDGVASLAAKGLSGAIYTQLADVEEEPNGYYTYDRKVLKIDAAKLRAAHEKVYEEARHAGDGK